MYVGAHEGSQNAADEPLSPCHWPTDKMKIRVTI